MIAAMIAKKICGYLPGDQTACKVTASWRVGVIVTDKRRMAEQVVWVPRMIVCNRHRLELNLDGVLLGVGWDNVVKSAVSKGHPKPKRSYTKLVFEHIRMVEFEQ